VKGLYLNALAYRPLKMGSESGTRFNNYGYYTITPRYERRHFGLYIPYTFSSTNDVTDYRENWLGLTMKLGPLFFGSSNLGSMAFNQTLKAADFFVGLKLGLTYGKPSNITRMLSTKKEAHFDSQLAERENQERTGTTAGNNSPVIRDTATNRMVVDYTKGQVYTDGKAGQVIIINNYYYGNAAANGNDSIYINRNVSFEAQQNGNRVDSMVVLAQKRKADSANRVLNDSLLQKREQLDSLINRLNNLRQRLDSTGRTDQSSHDNNQPNNFAGSVQDSATTGDSPLNITGRNDAAELSNEQRVQNEHAKKKVTAPYTPPRQRNRPSNEGMLQQQDNRDESYEAYRRQTERLQADIERLQRQMAYNRSVAYSNASHPNYNQRYASAPPTAVFYPAGAPAVSQPVREPIIIRDTIRIRDTVFIAKTDTVTKNVANTVFVAVPKETTVTEKIDYKKMPAENILFATGKATIGRVYEEKLSYLANTLRNNPDLKIAISGHTDKTGSRAANELLSLKRANSVKSFFVNRGIAESRMLLTAVAADDPLVMSDTKNAKAQNRRVEIKLLD
jgi:outer membrane protein OmpA-like peptidoglycan-associated protein